MFGAYAAYYKSIPLGLMVKSKTVTKLNKVNLVGEIDRVEKSKIVPLGIEPERGTDI